MAAPQAQPLPNIALFDAFRTPHPSVLTVKPHGMTDKRLDIIGNDGMPLLDCKGTILSRTKDFHDLNGQHLFSLETHSFDRHNAFTLHTLNGGTLLRIHRRFTLGRPKLDAHFTNAAAGSAGEAVVLELRYHGFTSRATSITWNGVTVASVERGGVWKHEWKVCVSAGMDQALAAALAVVLLRVYRQQQSSAAAGSAGGGA